jgi:hypothetical protein
MQQISPPDPNANLLQFMAHSSAIMISVRMFDSGIIGLVDDDESPDPVARRSLNLSS